jgi:hypothetical protein
VFDIRFFFYSVSKLDYNIVNNSTLGVYVQQWMDAALPFILQLKDERMVNQLTKGMADSELIQ